MTLEILFYFLFIILNLYHEFYCHLFNFFVLYFQFLYYFILILYYELYRTKYCFLRYYIDFNNIRKISRTFFPIIDKIILFLLQIIIYFKNYHYLRHCFINQHFHFYFLVIYYFIIHQYLFSYFFLNIKNIKILTFNISTTENFFFSTSKIIFLVMKCFHYFIKKFLILCFFKKQKDVK